MQNLNIFIWTWNTQSISYNNSNIYPDFLNELSSMLNYDLLIIGLQEDNINNSTLQSKHQNLIYEHIKHNYDLIKLKTLSGWGITTYKNLIENYTYRPRGLRLGIYKKRSSNLIISNIQYNTFICPTYIDWLTYGKGGIVITLHTNIGKISFLNIHLPFNSKSIIKNNNRNNDLLWQAYCLKYLYQNVINNHNPDFLFLFGDLNFRVQLRNEYNALEIVNNLFNLNYINELINEADELKLLLSYSQNNTNISNILPLLYEGINNNGPQFIPTCKLKKGRNNINTSNAFFCQEDQFQTKNIFKLCKYYQRTPSWCDRILFKNFENTNFDIKCIKYDRWDYGNMNLSDHASVIGIFSIFPK
jgi:hypothetical protein